MGPIQNLHELNSWLRRRRRVMMTGLILGGVASVLFALNSERVYNASAVIQVINPVVAVPGDGDGSGALPDVTRRVQIIEQRLMSREALLALAERYDLFGDAPLSTVEQVGVMRESFRINAIAAAQQGFARDGSLSALIVSVDDSNPARAAAIANELADALVAQSQSDRQNSAQQALEFFLAEEDRLEAEIGALEDAISAYRTENEQYLPAAVAVRREERARLSDALLDIQQEINDRSTILAGLDDASRRAVTQRQITQLNDEIMRYEEQAREVTARIDDIQRVLQLAPAVEQEIEAANRRIRQLQAQLTTAAERRREAELGARIEDDQQSERFEILERALVPDYPVSTSRKRVVAMGLVAGLGLGMMLAFVLEWMNPVLRTAQRMERELQLRPVASIPLTMPVSERRRRQAIWAMGLGLLVIGVLIAAMSLGLV